MANSSHNEEAFEALIESFLLANGGYEAAPPTDFDRDLALLPGTLMEFVEATQPKAWGQLTSLHGDQLRPKLLAALTKKLDQVGTLEVLRRGLKFYGQRLQLAYFEPGAQHDPGAWQLFEANRLTVIRQLRYDLTNENELDLALFVNGLPVATIELKNAMTGQKAGNARQQYRNDRDPKARLFAWGTKGPQRALVHFAVDTDEAYMTTRLAKDRTVFLPFNRGNNLGAGNPPVEGKHRTAYLWEVVLERRSLLDILARFLHVQVKETNDPSTGQTSERRTLIFPRYHQLDCVRKLVAESRERGAGKNYLIQHSAGSGKSNSIAWLAHRLSSLHNAAGEKVYHTVIVITDRRVLDQQLQDTIYQFDHTPGVVERIDKHSNQLAEALESGAPIIISTIHKFGFIQDKIESLPDRRYAVIVDEAHSSQTGEMAVAMKEALSDSSIEERLEEAGDDLDPTEALALRAALFRGPQPNLSFFAFTATPKYKTLEMFGHRDASGKPVPFHLYSMRQAIEEAFIHDVLKGYTTYRQFYALQKAVADDPELDKRRAAAALAKFVNLHPSNIAQKVEVIVEHFRSCVAGLLGGKAKAMVVTDSRLAAVRYKRAMDAYIASKGYRGLGCLVAFSGEVRDPDFPETPFTEPGMNQGIKETELPEKFASAAYQVLIVANKYQTGFDQPLLCAMYVDRRLAGIQAVQTLSRLNRKYTGKESTFVLDFRNESEEILAAFQDYYETTAVSEIVDPQRLYELETELESTQLWTRSEVNAFAGVFFKLPADKSPEDHGPLNAWLDPAVDRFKAWADEGNEGKARQEQVRGQLAAFRNLYSFLGQIVPFHDPDLEKLYVYVRLLLKKLPRPEGPPPWDPGEDVILKDLRLKKEAEDDLELAKGESGELPPPSSTGTGGASQVHERLSTIIQRLNERFGLSIPEDAQHLVDGLTTSLAGDAQVQQSARVNDRANFGIDLIPKLKDRLISHHSSNSDFVDQVLGNEEVWKSFGAMMAEQVYLAMNT